MTDPSAELQIPLLTAGNDHAEEEQQFRRSQITVDTTAPGLSAGRSNSSDNDDDFRSVAYSSLGGGTRDDEACPPEVARASLARCLSTNFCSAVARSVWSPNLLSLFVLLTWKDDKDDILLPWSLSRVGIVQATLGLSQTLAGIWVTNSTHWCHYNGSTFCSARVMGWLGIRFPALIVALWALVIQTPHGTKNYSSFGWFLALNGLLGAVQGTLDVLLPMNFVQSFHYAMPSISNNDDATLNATKVRERWDLGTRLGAWVGTILIGILFAIVGNSWTVRNSFLVLLYGALVPAVFLGVWSCWIWGTTEEASSQQTNNTFRDVEDISPSNSENFYSVGSFDDDEDQGIFISTGSTGDLFFSPREYEEEFEPMSSPPAAAVDGEDTTETTPTRSCCCADQCLVPWLIHLSDALSSIASGMSTWYLPVFLVKLFDLRPVTVQVLYFMILACQWKSPQLAKDLTKTLGPCRAYILLQFVYVGLLLNMIVCHPKGIGVWIVSCLFIFHGALMNSTSVLSKVLIAAFVPLAEQPKWEKAETIQKLLWSSAGLLGSYVVSGWGLITNLYVTAAVQVLASLPLVVLYCARDPRFDYETTRMEQETRIETLSEQETRMDRRRRRAKRMTIVILLVLVLQVLVLLFGTKL